MGPPHPCSQQQNRYLGKMSVGDMCACYSAPVSSLGSQCSFFTWVFPNEISWRFFPSVNLRAGHFPVSPTWFTIVALAIAKSVKGLRLCSTYMRIVYWVTVPWRQDRRPLGQSQRTVLCGGRQDGDQHTLYWFTETHFPNGQVVKRARTSPHVELVVITEGFGILWTPVFYSGW